MVSSAAATVGEYLDELPKDRAAVVSAVRDLVNASLPAGYEEGMLYGMITWMVPLDVYPDTYNRKPLAYVSLAAQKHHYALYLMGVYADSVEEARFREQWSARGTKLDMGKSCLRFRTTADLQEDLVAEVIAAVPMDEHIARAKAAQSDRR
jgi:Arc/MetJ family transcription regulator